MKALLFLGFGLLSSTLLTAQVVRVEYDWHQVAKEGGRLPGEIVASGERALLRLVNTNDTPKTFRLLSVTNLPALGHRYGMVGQIQYENVVGDGYLELLSSFKPTQTVSAEAQFFTRTLSSSGAMGRISLSSDWRNFTLPFDRTGTTNPPTKLELNLVLPSRGTVLLGSCQLVDYSASGWGRWSSNPDAWWSERTGGFIGGIGGTSLGCYASLLSILASRGRARALVLASWRILLLIGVFLLLTGLAAILLHQPYEVWFVLVLSGALLVGIAPARLRQVRRNYEELELRKISAADAR